MSMKGIVICLILSLTIALSQSSDCWCPPHFIATNGKCYYFSESSVSSWKEAFTLCEFLGAELLSIETERENFMIDAYLTKRGRDMLYWTSGLDEQQNGQWKWKSINKDFTFTKWGPGEPSNNNKAEYCVEIIHEKGITIWNDALCNQSSTYKRWPLYYICEKSMISNTNKETQNQDQTCSGTLKTCDALSQQFTIRKCPVNFVHIAGKCYHFAGGPNTWEEAYKNCEALKSSLVAIETQAEAFALGYYMVQQNRVINYWTSGSDDEVEGQWEWTSTEKPIVYTQWCPGQPDNSHNVEHYLHIQNINGNICWNDLPKNRTHTGTPLGYICESSISP